MENECKWHRLPAPFHTSWESPHPPVDEGPRVQCGALPPQTSLIGGKENGEQMKSSFIRSGWKHNYHLNLSSIYATQPLLHVLLITFFKILQQSLLCLKFTVLWHQHAEIWVKMHLSDAATKHVKYVQAPSRTSRERGTLWRATFAPTVMDCLRRKWEVKENLQEKLVSYSTGQFSSKGKLLSFIFCVLVSLKGKCSLRCFVRFTGDL